MYSTLVTTFEQFDFCGMSTCVVGIKATDAGGQLCYTPLFFKLERCG